MDSKKLKLPAADIQPKKAVEITCDIPIPDVLALGATANPAASSPAVSASKPASQAEALKASSSVVIEAPRDKSVFRKYWELVGGGSLTVSLLVHACLIALFVAIVTVTVHEPKVDFMPGGGSKQGEEASQQLAYQVRRKKLKQVMPLRKVASNNVDAAIRLPDLPADALKMAELSMPLARLSASGGFGSSGAGGGFGGGTGMGGGKGFIGNLPSALRSRCSPVERLQKLKESGGNAECERAISAALEYLRTQQNADGSWGLFYRGGMTGFALLCYFGRCETPDSAFYGDNVTKGILYLIELSKKHKGMMSESKAGTGAVYEHGIATYALGEMYSLARLGGKSLPGMREAFTDGVQLIIKKQLPTGGWAYDITGGYASSGRSDPSVTGWHYQALKAAKLSGLNFPGLSDSIDKAVRYLASIQTKDGGFGGINPDEGAYTQWTMTGVAVLGLQTLGHGEGDKIRKGVKWLYDLYQKERPVWNDANFYVWYYVAQVFFQNGGVEWKFWNDTALPEILAHQEKDGRWISPTNHHGANSGGNDIYPTALCTLMLEVYYRYLKVGDREEKSLFERRR